MDTTTYYVTILAGPHRMYLSRRWYQGKPAFGPYRNARAWKTRRGAERTISRLGLDDATIVGL